MARNRTGTVILLSMSVSFNLPDQHTLNAFEKAFDLPKPKCCSTGDCCKGVSPSTPFHQLLKRASQGDEFARNFFSIMVPYISHEAASKEVPGIVERSLAAVKKLDDFKQGADDIVFYRCRYLQPDNRCGVHEDRPQFCRDYPDTPYVVMAPGCAYVPWAAACKKKYRHLNQELAELKAEESKLKQEKGSIDLGELDCTDYRSESDIDDENWRLVLSLTPLYLSSPMLSLLFESV